MESTKSKKSEYNRSYFKKYLKDPMNRIKRRARLAIQERVYKGKLKRSPCRICGKPNAEAHHDDYTKRLDVDWLCRKHHALVDGGFKKKF